jgi:glutamine synthetase
MAEQLTKESITKIVEEQNIEFIRVMFTDVFGVIKNVEIPNSQLQKLLNNDLLFDGSSIDGFVRIEESDMYLYPDLETFKVLPASLAGQDAGVAMVIANIYTSSRVPFEGDPRYRLISQLEKMKEQGFDEFNLGTEPEFF